MENPDQSTKIQCARCGLESGLEEAFTKRRTWLVGPVRAICPNCERDRQLRSAAFAYLLLPGTALVAYVARPNGPGTLWLVGATLVLLLGIPMAVLHELAHVLVASAVGGRVLNVTIGFGRSLLNRRLLGVFWDIRLVPVGGVTRIAIPEARLLRLRAWLVYAAGPGLHLLLALLAWMAWLGSALFGGAHRSLSFWASVLLYANLLPFLVNLLPLKVVTPFGVTGSDGWHLLKLPFFSKDETLQLVNRGYAGAAVIATRHKQFEEAARLLETAKRSGPSDPEVANAVGFLSLAKGNLPAARRAFSEGLEHCYATNPSQRYLLLNNIAYVDALLEDPAFLGEADEYSRQAHENAPWVPQFSGTRGAVLAARGDHAAGIHLLKAGLQGADGPDAKAENASLLALAEARRGNTPQAESYLRLARRLDPDCYLVPIVEARFPDPSLQPGRPGNLSRETTDQARPEEAAPSRAWWLAPETWGMVSAVWGFWNLLAGQAFTISPGVAFFLLAVGIGLIPHPGLITALGLALTWIGLLNLLGGGLAPSLYGGLNVLLAVLLFTYQRRRASATANRDPDEKSVGQRQLGLGLPLLSALTGAAAALSMAPMLLWLAATAVNFAANNPGSGLNGFFQGHGQLFSIWYLVEPLALTSGVTGMVAVVYGARKRWLALVGLVLATPILLVALGLAVLDRFF